VAAPKPPVKTVVTAKPNLSPRAQAEVKPVVYSPPTAVPVQSVQVAPEPKIVTTPGAAPSPENPPLVSTFVAKGVTPLPGEAAAAKKPVTIIPPAPVYFPRYNYISPRTPAAGDRRAAGSAFNQARLDEQDQKWSDALANYRQAAGLDPSWFEAQYNASVLAQRQGEYSAALAGYEKALALKPDSVDARYNFALALKAAGYVPDAANELKKVLATNPDETRAHLALANLCAQSLHDPAQARKHYLKVLELDPTNARAADIRFWLAANP
jgi:tetratricopeptide (TPR) repeat protein